MVVKYNGQMTSAVSSKGTARYLEEEVKDMPTTLTAERRAIYRKIHSLSEEKAARVMGYIQSLELDEEPDLTDDEEEGLRAANAELTRGEGRSFREARAQRSF